MDKEMKVIRIIVNKLPNRCYDCHFWNQDILSREGYVCIAKDDKHMDSVDEIPDWCPLDIEHMIFLDLKMPNPAEVEKILKEFKKKNKNISL